MASQPSSDNDRQSFFETVNALNILGFSQEDQDLMWKVLASILHLGNIEIADKTQKNPGDSDSCYISVSFYLLHFDLGDVLIIQFDYFLNLVGRS